ncbi:MULTISPECIES: flagellar hook assembly protein FlgD [Enterobacteriaceae]|uniref:Flagellar L-ring protein n=21 Tax=Gammaproteobacteria TaxID=1236 RepID=A0AAE5JYD4_SHISO|nr:MULTISPECIES: flagellar hook assembly protein FlgD [Enterobacteriaceae]OYG87485.1 flagellar basal body L-ring protein [Shigella sonnei]OYI08140.1 flagellar basal body L-ring protein [Shigella sonnei]HAX7494504.1 flagellar hook assembly protein FlgD [Escherichia coli]
MSIAVTTTDPTNTGVSTTSSSSLTGSNAADLQSSFLTLLVAQLKNQDPTNPMENNELTSQLAQISTVSGIEKLNTTLGSISGQIDNSQSLQASNLIGHGVMIPGTTVLAGTGSEEGAVTTTTPFGVELQQAADKVTATITDKNGAVVRTIDIGELTAGVHSFTWDGTLTDGSTAPNGSYNVAISASNGGTQLVAQPLQFALVQGATSAQPVPGPTPVANGSIFQSAQPINYGYQPLFEDRRPRNIGDTLTIVLQENVSASKSSSANASRDGKTNFGFDTVPRYLQGLFGNARADVEASGGNTFNGKGGANASNTFSGTLTVTVDQVLVNGNLHVVGEKQIAINQGTEFIRFSGVVNPRTISGSNTVPSTQVADARIEYVGNGYINEAQNMGWLQRFFLNLSPM